MTTIALVVRKGGGAEMIVVDWIGPEYRVSAIPIQDRVTIAQKMALLSVLQLYLGAKTARYLPYLLTCRDCGTSLIIVADRRGVDIKIPRSFGAVIELVASQIITVAAAQLILADLIRRDSRGRQ